VKTPSPCTLGLHLTTAVLSLVLRAHVGDFTLSPNHLWIRLLHGRNDTDMRARRERCRERSRSLGSVQGSRRHPLSCAGARPVRRRYRGADDF
jgi:hypothetical protein